MAQILVVDDDKSIIESFRVLFEDIHNVIGAYNGDEAIKLISSEKVDLIFLDYRIPGMDGIETLKKIKKIDPEIYVIVISGYGDFETIIQSISYGAYDYIEKPLDVEKINLITKRALETKKVNSYVKLIKDSEKENYSLKSIIGKSQAMQNVFKIIGKLVNNDVTVLITGESGTGKELIARAIHYNGIRKDEPFIAVNCSGLTETLLDNELFGHEAQAYTGATTQKKGKFEAAGEGTIFLDEIGDMPLSIQSKLLRVLQEKEFHRLGGNRTIKLKARIITATNKDLVSEIKKGNFREDLYYRINVAHIEIPPLRERTEDIPYLVNHFIKKSNRKLRKYIKGISVDALNALQEYHWPGNVRELENIIMNVCINLQDNYIDSVIIPNYNNFDNSGGDIVGDFIDRYIKKYGSEDDLYRKLISRIEDALFKKIAKKVNNNKSVMSRILGLSRVTLQKKLQNYKDL